MQKGADNVEPDLLVRIHVQLRFDLVWALLWFGLLQFGFLWCGFCFGLRFTLVQGLQLFDLK